MSATKGELTVDDLGQEFFLETNHRYGLGLHGGVVYRIAKVEGDGEDFLANARLLAAAWNSYQRLAALTGADPVYLAERDVLAELYEAARFTVAYGGTSAIDEALAACRKPEDVK